MSEGIDSIENLLSKYKTQIASVKKQSVQSTASSAKSTPKRPAVADAISKSKTASKIASLGSYVDVNKLKAHHSPKDLELIWRARHAQAANTICSLVQANLFDRMWQFARTHPTFILPLPRALQEGYDVHFLQWSSPAPFTTNVILTSLIEFKLHGEYARPHTTISYFSDLAQDKDVVFVRGEIDADRNINADDARFLFVQLQRFYGGYNTDERQLNERLGLVKAFSSGDDSFSMEKLLEATEKL